jgi:predicted nucleic acid-binding protein
MILVDTSVWIEHFRGGVPRLKELLGHGTVLTHPAIIGELACGNLRQRDQILADLQRLPRVPVADSAETLYLIESKRLWGRGIGWTDALLIASALLTRSELWTLDRKLEAVARSLKIGGA